MKRLLVILASAAILAFCGAHVELGPPKAHAIVGSDNGGDSTLAAAGSFKIYPFFVNGGGHIHNSQFVQDANGVFLNGYAQATSGFVATSLSSVRIRIFGPAGVDTTGRTVQAGESYPIVAPFDSVDVLNTGGTQTLVRWRCIK